MRIFFQPQKLCYNKIKLENDLCYWKKGSIKYETNPLLTSNTNSIHLILRKWLNEFKKNTIENVELIVINFLMEFLKLSK